MSYVPADQSIVLIPGNRIVIMTDVVLNYGTFQTGTTMTCISADPVLGYSFIDDDGNQLNNTMNMGQFWCYVAPCM